MYVLQDGIPHLVTRAMIRPNGLVRESSAHTLAGRAAVANLESMACACADGIITSDLTVADTGVFTELLKRRTGRDLPASACTILGSVYPSIGHSTEKVFMGVTQLPEYTPVDNPPGFTAPLSTHLISTAEIITLAEQ